MLYVNGSAIAPGSATFEREDVPNQVRNVMADGTVRVREVMPDENYVTFNLPRVSNTAYGTLRTIITDTKNYASTAFTVVDDHGESFTGRFWDKSLKATRRLGRYWSVSFRLRLS